MSHQRKESLPPETIDVINRIADANARNVFAFLDPDDIRSEVWVICLTALDEFDKNSGYKLEHFLRVTVKNRLVNKFKEMTKSVNSPCPKCPYYDPGNSVNDCGKYGENRHHCKKWSEYNNTVVSRNALLNPTVEGVERSYSSNPLKKMILDELLEVIRPRLREEFIHSFETLVSGGKVHKSRLKKLQSEISKCFSKEEQEKIREMLT
jgi:hypothetical protein